jgi:hypothetical protein
LSKARRGTKAGKAWANKVWREYEQAAKISTRKAIISDKKRDEAKKALAEYRKARKFANKKGKALL